MASAELFEFLSNMFAAIHNRPIAFGGIKVIVAGDLAQLPSVTGSFVFKSSVWKLFLQVEWCQIGHQPATNRVPYWWSIGLEVINRDGRFVPDFRQNLTPIVHLIDDWLLTYSITPLVPD